MILNIRDKNIFEFRSFSLRIITIFAFLLCVYSVKAQNLEHVAFDTNGAMGECLFPQDENGKAAKLKFKKIWGGIFLVIEGEGTSEQ